MGDIRMVKNIFCWVLTAVLACSAAAKMRHDYHWARFRVVNSLMTSLEFNDLLALEQPGPHVTGPQIKHFKDYFEQVALLMPAQADAHAMAGFCFYHLGRKTQALKEYQKAIAINPEFLWFYYNAGMICFLQGNYGQAAAYFQKALLTKPEINLAIISQSKVFTDILRHAPRPVDVPGRLKEGYGLSVYFSRLSAHLAQAPSGQNPDVPPEHLRLRMF